MSTFFYHAKRQSFYHRSIIPRRLRPYFNGRIQYWRNLRTEDKDQPRARSAQWEARVQRVFVTLIHGGEGMTKGEIESLIGHWMEQELDEAEDFRATCARVSGGSSPKPCARFCARERLYLTPSGPPF